MLKSKYCPRCEQWVQTEKTSHHCGFSWGPTEQQMIEKQAQVDVSMERRRSSDKTIVTAIIVAVVAVGLLVGLLIVLPRTLEYSRCKSKCEDKHSSCMDRAENLARVFGNNSLGYTSCTNSQVRCEQSCFDWAIRPPF